MEHAIRNLVQTPTLRKWFTTGGIYTSCHDLISRILQFDVDGDQLNVIYDPLFVSIAERNVKEFNVVPLFYDALKAPPHIICQQSYFEGLLRAHEYSGIGQVSNGLTKLWNRPNPDREVAAWLAAYNNFNLRSLRRVIAYCKHGEPAQAGCRFLERLTAKTKHGYPCMSMIVSSESSRRCNDYPETEYGTGESPAPEAPCSHENEMKK